MARRIPGSITRRRGRRLLWRAGLYVSFSLTLLLGIVYGLQRDEVRIRDIVVEGEGALDEEWIRTQAASALAGYTAHVLPRDSIFFYPKSQVKDTLLSGDARLKSVSVSRKSIRTLAVSVLEREGEALWCGISPENSLPCHFLDAEGVVYAEAPIFSGSVYIRFYGALSSSTPLRALYAPGFFPGLLSLVRELGSAEDIREVFFNGKDVFAIYESGAELRFSGSEGAERTLAKWRAIREEGPLKEVPLSDIRYVDLRFGNKAVYRLR